MSIKVFYNHKQSVATNASFSPSAGKPKLVIESWKNLPVPIEIVKSGKASRAAIASAHSREYVDGVMECLLPNGFGNRSLAIARSLPWVTGSMLDATNHSILTGEPAFSPTSGAHHACHSYGGGFCTFNFLVVAAIEAHRRTSRNVAILDVDRHYGNGTDEIKSRLNLYWLQHETFGARSITAGAAADRWIDGLRDTIKNFGDIALLIYNAGVDSHVDDPLGGILTTEQLLRRDRTVYETAAALGIPIVTSLAGGYQRDENDSPAPVLRLHDSTLQACADAYGYIVRSPEEQRSILKILEELYELGELDIVIQAIEMVKAKSKLTNGRLWLLYGVCLGKLGHHKESASAFLQSLLLSRNQLSAVNYVTALLASEEIEQACTMLEIVYNDLDADMRPIVARSFIEAIRIGAIDPNQVPQSFRSALSNIVTI